MPLYRPPYRVTSQILKLVAEISEVLGELKSLRVSKPNPKLRKQNSIRTIQGSLAIEGNSFSLSQVSDVLEGKRVLGHPKEIFEVKNAIECYGKISKFDPYSSKSLLAAHRALMDGLIHKPGFYRTGAVGILKGSEVSHIAPKAERVPELISQLLIYLKSSKDIALIKSCVFHYEFEFIHPFLDGNGRMGRLWQTLILTSFNPIFEFIPIESQIYQHQSEYYRVLEKCDKKGDSTEFIEWMLAIIYKELCEFSKVCFPEVESSTSRIEIARKAFGRKKFTRLQYLNLIKTISAPTASRDLAEAIRLKILTKTGEKRTTQYQFA